MSGISVTNRDAQELTDPRALPNLEAWYDSRYPNGIGSALPFDGDPLSTWTDLSGKGRHLTQPTAAKRPLWRKTSKNLVDYSVAVGTVNPNLNGSGKPVMGVDGLGLNYNTSSNNGTPSNPSMVQDSDNPVLPGSAGVRGCSLMTKDIGWCFTGLRPLHFFSSEMSFWIGKTITLSAWVKTPVSNLSSIFRMGAVDGYRPVTHTVTPNAWTRITRTYTVPSGVTGFQIDLGWEENLAPVGTTLKVTGIQVEISDSVTDWAAPAAVPNGSPVVQADGVDDCMFSILPRLGSGTIYLPFYAHLDSSGAWARMMALGRESEGVIMWNRSNGSNDISGRVDLGPTDGYNQGMSGLADKWGDGQWHIAVTRFDIPSLQARHRFDGVNAGLKTMIAGAAQTMAEDFTLFTDASRGLPTEMSGAEIGGAMVFSGYHDDALVSKVERMISRNFGIAVNT